MKKLSEIYRGISSRINHSSFINLGKQIIQNNKHDNIKTRVGIVPSFGICVDGQYQYTLTLLDILRDISKEKNCPYTFISFDSIANAHILDQYVGPNWQNVYSNRHPILRKISNQIGKHIRFPFATTTPSDITQNPKTAFAHWLEPYKLDWIFFTAPAPPALEIDLPFVIPIHDLQHRLQPDLPEFLHSNEWKRREALFRHCAQYAMFLLVDSEVGKEDLLNLYSDCSLTEDRIMVLPFIPPTYLSLDTSEEKGIQIRKRFKLPARYLFYPAQFWPHKNHINIINAIAQLYDKQGIEVHAVFCGSHTGPVREKNFQTLQESIERLKIRHLIHFLGFVKNEDIAALYLEAKALIMPTFFGPTNIPVLEAWLMECPVITSDIRGIREQVGDAGILINPRSIDEIANAIYKIWIDKSLQRNLVIQGRQALHRYTPKDFRTIVEKILFETTKRVKKEWLLYNAYETWK